MPQLCASVSPYLASSVAPGSTASFAIFVWTTAADSSGTSVTVSIAKAGGVDAPAFAVCSSPKGATCALGSLLTGTSTELVAGAATTATVPSGTKVTLTAAVKAGGGAKPFQAHATVTIMTGAVSPSASALPGLPALPSSSLPGFTLPGASLPDGAFTTPTNPSGLFPTVSPGGTGGSGRSHAGHRGATTDAATLPLDSRLIGWQLAGLVVLASAIAIAVVRLSLRTRSRDGDAALQQN